jgi:hypothetical protein
MAKMKRSKERLTRRRRRTVKRRTRTCRSSSLLPLLVLAVLRLARARARGSGTAALIMFSTLVTIFNAVPGTRPLTGGFGLETSLV